MRRLCCCVLRDRGNAFPRALIRIKDPRRVIWQKTVDFSLFKPLPKGPAMTDHNADTGHLDANVAVPPKRGTTTLMHGMGDRLGVDVDRAVASGVIDAPELAQMVTRCGSCTQHDACILWMVEHQTAQTHAPEYCLNTQELSYIRAVQNGDR
jgi:hypothetical protein